MIQLEQERAGAAKTVPTVYASVTAGDFCRLDGQEMQRLVNYDAMAPFFMTIVSDSDHWMFLSSTGGLTAGRGSSERALFPYEVVDKLHEAMPHTGPRTILRVWSRHGQAQLWEPFTTQASDTYQVQRTLYKSPLGNSVAFEEHNTELGLTFRYQWQTSRDFGFVRTATLVNTSTNARAVEVLDGLQNLVPAGVTVQLQQAFSCLADAYKRAEVAPETTLGVFSLSSLLTDRAMPAEALRATTVWSSGLDGAEILLSSAQAGAFRKGQPVHKDTLQTGKRGAYLTVARFTLEAGGRKQWYQVANVHQDHQQVACLHEMLRSGGDVMERVRQDMAQGDKRLWVNVASADALQLSASRVTTVHHAANVLFNNMRGGIFVNHYRFPTKAFKTFLSGRNKAVAEQQAGWLKALPEEMATQDLLAQATATQDADLLRLAYEFLPLTFGRRHGDPSRPWNHFAIRSTDESGNAVIHYEGNWRDIFQNWEALSLSYPGFITHVIAKFVNASTVDGFNPYRVTNEGLDWEAPNPGAPWSNIGYWGDHQIVYLLKFLEASDKYQPGQVAGLLNQALFCYVDVPYRIKPYAEILKNNRDTIVFDYEREHLLTERRKQLGADGVLLQDGQDHILHVTLAEKLLVPALSKLSNLVLEGGIWMNTQRPEWNDANNALVGAGLSVVTLGYLRRYLNHLSELCSGLGEGTLVLSAEVAGWLEQVGNVLQKHRGALKGKVDDTVRRMVLDELGGAFDAYRSGVYAKGLSAAVTRQAADVVAFCRLCLEYIDHSLRANRRADKLYHSYNLLTATPGTTTAAVTPLYEMLEGQVAILSSGMLTPAEALQVVQALYTSRMYRADQHSFMLYPERNLPGYLEKNRIPADWAQRVSLFAEMTEAGDRTLVSRDPEGVYRFNSDLRNAEDLDGLLDRLQKDPRWQDKIARQRGTIQQVYEEVFQHQFFTGRSGTMYAYEGLGSIYWHMVSKLLLAVQENYWQALAQEAPREVVTALAEMYYRVRAGLSFNKTPQQYGAFPTDPYSHTPRGSGAQQPGMTGQVKEEILTRWGELGVQVVNGAVRFAPSLLQKREILKEHSTFKYCALDGVWHEVPLPPGTLAFTFCQVPVIYHVGTLGPAVQVHLASGPARECAGLDVPAELSREIFSRSGRVVRVEVFMAEKLLLAGG